MRASLFFLLSLLLLLLAPSLPLLFFAPYLVICSYQLPKFATLWRALGVGLLISLFSSSETFGLLPLTYCAASFCIFFHTRYFFADKAATLPIMTYLFSLYASLFYYLFLPLVGQPMNLSGRLIATEILIAPLSDSLFAGIVTLIFSRKGKAAT